MTHQSSSWEERKEERKEVIRRKGSTRGRKDTEDRQPLCVWSGRRLGSEGVLQPHITISSNNNNNKGTSLFVSLNFFLNSPR
ncbi:hypothetical protein EYF80_063237 [Liparis tanakae]|uniref:Uncharacterized protein n=1 Tax=Liparis tanakae TaxID=230148 RepID=A0A4Z2ECJ6_9TELE|nr:hypothetical protein EYF80_063237 [Liparis tanakae]